METQLRRVLVMTVVSEIVLLFVENKFSDIRRKSR